MGQSESKNTSYLFDCKFHQLNNEILKNYVIEKIVVPNDSRNQSKNYKDSEHDKIEFYIDKERKLGNMISNPEILSTLIPYVGDELIHLFHLNKIWFLNTYSFLTKYFVQDLIENLKHVCMNRLKIELVTFSIQPLFTNKRKFRLDLLVYCEVLCSFFASNTLNLRLNHKTLDSKKWKKIEYEFKILPKNKPRRIKIQREESGSDKREFLKSQIIDHANICVGDYILIPIPLRTESGWIDIDSVNWCLENIKINNFSLKDLEKNSNNTESRHQSVRDIQKNDFFQSEIEDLRWYDSHSFRERYNFKPPKLNIFIDDFAVLQASHALNLNSYTKMVYKPLKTGIIKMSKSFFGFKIRIIPDNQALTVCLKRKGLQHDRLSELQMRLKDKLEFIIIYDKLME